jgi:hypothetical protein
MRDATKEESRGEMRQKGRSDIQIVIIAGFEDGRRAVARILWILRTTLSYHPSKKLGHQFDNQRNKILPIS